MFWIVDSALFDQEFPYTREPFSFFSSTWVVDAASFVVQVYSVVVVVEISFLDKKFHWDEPLEYLLLHTPMPLSALM